jgi:hypothetical protein
MAMEPAVELALDLPFPAHPATLIFGAVGDVGDKKSKLPPGNPPPEQAKLQPEMLEC